MQDDLNPEPVVGDAPPTANTWLSNSAYDKLKFLTQVVLPGVGALYFALAGIWGLPAAEQVVGSIVAVDAFLGLFLGASTKQYMNTDARFDGAVNISPHPEDPENASNLHVQLDPASLAEKDEITVKVNRDNLV